MESVFSVKKCDIRTGVWIDCGTYNEADIKLIVRGYHFNGLFYEKSNSYTIYDVEKIHPVE